MATFFGEVLSVFSRAVEDDEEELEESEEDEDILRELEEKRQVRVHWGPALELIPNTDHRLHCPHLLLTVGHNASRFVSVFFLSRGDWDAVGHVSLWNERTLQSEGSACVLYRHRDSHMLMCQVDCFVAEDQLFQWTEQVLSSLEPSQVTVLSDCPAAEYQSAQPLGTAPRLRSIHTSACSEPTCCPPVELPNLVSGLPAAVMSFCQLQNISAVVYQCYSDVRSADSTAMDTFRPAVEQLAHSLNLDLCPDQDVLRKVISQAAVQSNLYI
ncbi:proteasome assembly chaperone 1 [Eucyclogobius newberryi]|uniref:proteasome assembly chaperone 1 n=1 Tax=Eucyclogobius newberryi TaxID=166745 RepID=UPI003B5B6350